MRHEVQLDLGGAGGDAGGDRAFVVRQHQRLGSTAEFVAEEVEPEVKAEWLAEQVELTRQRAYEAMRGRYEVVLPQPPENR